MTKKEQDYWVKFTELEIDKDHARSEIVRKKLSKTYDSVICARDYYNLLVEYTFIHLKMMAMSNYYYWYFINTRSLLHFRNALDFREILSNMCHCKKCRRYK